MDERVQRTINALKKNKISACYYENSEAAVQALLEEINDQVTVGVGGSVTVNDLEIPQKLAARGNKVLFHWLEPDPGMKAETRKKAGRADVYLCSTNALTEQGQLVNIDGVGNRVTAMIFGPQKVIVICGVNKLVKNIDEALERIKTTAYKNARRLNLATPCAVTGECNDCDSPERMCNVTTIIEKKPGATELKVMIIGEDLGF